ncbi:MAG: hypothetical protein IT350_13140 [Deltaproteobacteria bacterium]|nr:hypothetical protein [Deltaproteobacteria bacterium]
MNPRHSRGLGRCAIGYLTLALMAACVLGAPAIAADRPVTRSVFVYMVDVTNTMTGCVKCYMGRRTDDMLPATFEHIIDELRLANKPVVAYVVPFSRGVVDFDGDGPFEPWRKFEITNDLDVDALAEYLDPKKGKATPPGAEPPMSKLLPTYGPSRGAQEPWPGFHEASLAHDYLTPALYDATVEGLNHLRSLVPRDRDLRIQYARTHQHKLVVFSDGKNAVKSASYPHIVQGAELHRDEMDGRFWLTRVYMEGKIPDETVDAELFEERRIAQSARGVYRIKDKALPPPTEMVRLAAEDLVYAEGLRDPSRYVGGTLVFNSGIVIKAGSPPSLSAAVEDSPVTQSPAGAGVSIETPATQTPASAATDITFRLSGANELLQSGLETVTSKVRLTLPTETTGRMPLFLESGAPELYVYLDADLSPPTSRVKVEVTPPGHVVAQSDGPTWDLGGYSQGDITAGRVDAGRIAFKSDSFIPTGPVFTIEYDESFFEILRNDIAIASGSELGLDELEIRLRPGFGKGPQRAIIELRSSKAHVVFEGDQASWKGTFSYTVKSDWPYVAGIAVVVAIILGGVVVVLRRTVLRSPRIADVGGKLNVANAPEGASRDEINLAAMTGSSWVAGKNPQCAYVLDGEFVPDAAFEIRVLRNEGRLRVRKADPEVENVLLNGVEMAESFLKDGDVIAVQGYEFVYRRS